MSKSAARATVVLGFPPQANGLGQIFVWEKNKNKINKGEKKIGGESKEKKLNVRRRG